MRKFLFIMILLLATSMFAVPPKMLFQGRFIDSFDIPYDGTYVTSFGIYYSPTGGSALWEETQSLTLYNGLMNTYLGEVNPLPDSIFNGSILYLEIIFDSSTMIRQPLVTVPYAFATNLDTLAAYLDTTFSGSVSHIDSIEYVMNITHIDSVHVIDSITYVRHITHIDSITAIDSIEYIMHITHIDSVHAIDSITHISHVSHIDSISLVDSIHFIEEIDYIDSLLYAYFIDHISRIDSIGYIDSIGFIEHTAWASHVHWDSIVGIPDDLGGDVVSSLNTLTGDLNIVGSGGIGVSEIGSDIIVDLTLEPGDCSGILNISGGSSLHDYIPVRLGALNPTVGQFLMLNSDIGCTGGKISGIKFESNVTSGTVTNVDVFLDNVIFTDLAGRNPLYGSQVVNNSSITVGLDGTVVIGFDHAFLYSGENLLITIRKNSSTGFPISWFGYGTSTMRSRYNSTNNTYPLPTETSWRPNIEIDFYPPDFPDVVTTVNGENGDITIAGGTGIDVTTSDETVTISASGSGATYCGSDSGATPSTQYGHSDNVARCDHTHWGQQWFGNGTALELNSTQESGNLYSTKIQAVQNGSITEYNGLWTELLVDGIYGGNSIIGIANVRDGDGNVTGVYGRAENLTLGSTSEVIGVRGMARGFTNGNNYGGLFITLNDNPSVPGNSFGIYASSQSLGPTASGKDHYGLYARAVQGVINWAGYFNEGDVNIENDLYFSESSFGTDGPGIRANSSGVMEYKNDSGSWTTLSSGVGSVSYCGSDSGATPSTQYGHSDNVARCDHTHWGQTWYGDSLALRINSSNSSSSIANALEIHIDGLSTGPTVGLNSHATRNSSGSNGTAIGLWAQGTNNNSSGTGTTIGVRGIGDSGTSGDIYGGLFQGIRYAATTGDNYGVYAIANGLNVDFSGNSYALYATSHEGGIENWAGYFNEGDVNIENDLYFSESSFGSDGPGLRAEGGYIQYRNDGGSWINITGGVSGDNWGSQVVERNSTLSGNGTSSSPLTLNTLSSYGTYSYPSSISIDSYGRVTSVSSGSSGGTYDHWRFQANGTSTSYVYNSNTVNFIAGSGISLAKSANNITISSSSSGGDNLGDHSADMNLNMNGYDITSVDDISADCIGAGISASSTYKVRGYRSSSTWGALGYYSGEYNGVRGESSGHGVVGISSSNTNSAYAGVVGSSQSYLGALGHKTMGVYGETSSGYTSSTGALGYYSSSYGRVGVFGYRGSGSYAGYFNGTLYASTVSGGSKPFLIDHPVDPYNKVLRHYCVESPEVLCLYRGTVTLDESGEATVEMPTYYKSLVDEEGATVHPTPVGRPFMVGYEWNQDHLTFFLYGDAGREVSYIVYAERNDPTIEYLWQPVEDVKGDGKAIAKGHLLLPEAYGVENPVDEFNK